MNCRVSLGSSGAGNWEGPLDRIRNRRRPRGDQSEHGGSSAKRCTPRRCRSWSRSAASPGKGETEIDEDFTTSLSISKDSVTAFLLAVLADGPLPAREIDPWPSEACSRPERRSADANGVPTNVPLSTTSDNTAYRLSVRQVRSK